MNGNAIARLAKICALLGFFMPWALVSCSGQPIASITGLSLAVGDTPIRNPINGLIEHQHTSPNLLLLLAIVAIVAGIALSFGSADKANAKRTARALLLCSAAAAILCALSIMTLYSGRDQAIAKAQATNQVGGDVAAGMVQVQTQFGFWVTLLSLGVAFGASSLVVTDRETLLNAVNSEARRIAAEVAGASPAPSRDEDERYWDRLPDKGDANALEEYLHRFPAGKFASLARSRLQRAGIPVAGAPTTPTPTPEPAPDESSLDAPASALACPSCDTIATLGDRFCSACGSRLAI